MAKSKAYWALAATCLFWGSTWVVAKVAIQTMPVFQMTGIRQLVAGLLILLFFVKQIHTNFSAKRLWKNVYTGFFLITLSNGFSTYAMKFIPSGLAALIGCIFPLVLVLFNFLFYGKKVSIGVITAMLLALVGIVIIFADDFQLLGSTSFIKGIAFCLIAVCTWTIGTLLNYKQSTSQKVDQQTENVYENLGWQMLTSGVTTLCFSYMFLPNQNLALISSASYLYILYLIVFGSIISFISYVYTLKSLPLQISSLYAYVNPIVAMLLGFVILHEKLNAQIISGTLITLLGVYLVKRLSEKTIQL